MPDALIIDAVRTPRGIGKQGKGALAYLHPQHLGRTVLEALVERNGFDTADVDDVVWGTSAQSGPQGGDIGRMSALDAGYDIKASGVTLDRFCGSGITANNIAAHGIMAGMDDLVVAGGTEMMSIKHKGMLPMGAGNDAPPGAAPPVAPGRVRRRHRHPRGHQPRGPRRPRSRVPAPGGGADRRGPLRPQPRPGEEPRRRRSRWTTRSSPARRRRSSRWPSCPRASRRSPTTATRATRRSGS